MKSENIRTTLPPAPMRHAEKLRAAGLKVTGPRLAILGLLEHDRSHPGAEDVLGALRGRHPSLSLSTVYKTLEAFVRAGLCRHVAGDGALLRVDGTLDPHDHAMCRVCGAVFDVDRETVEHPVPPARLAGGLTVTGIRVEYDVVCAGCGRTGRPGTQRERTEHAERASKTASTAS